MLCDAWLHLKNIDIALSKTLKPKNNSKDNEEWEYKLITISLYLDYLPSLPLWNSYLIGEVFYYLWSERCFITFDIGQVRKLQ